MNFRKFISSISALTIAASTFVGLAVTASAADGDVTTNADITFSNTTTAEVEMVSTTYNGAVGSSPIVAMDDFKLDGKKYSCDSNDLGTKTILADGSLVVNVACTEIPSATEITVNYKAGDIDADMSKVTVPTAKEQAEAAIDGALGSGAAANAITIDITSY